MSANLDAAVIGIDAGTGGQLPPDRTLQMPAVATGPVPTARQRVLT